MYSWYKHSKICYAFLADVKASPPSGWASGWAGNHFIKSRWFTRGWTLQELIAPRVVQFYNADWVELGTKSSLKGLISQITGIDVRVLVGAPPSTCNVARRLSWASTRETTRIEDVAYSLIGLFDVNMPLLYGEGTRAFRRLQEEILKESEDYTILAWKHRQVEYDDYEAAFAPSPSSFCRLSRCTLCRQPTSEFNWDYHELVHFRLSRLRSMREKASATRDYKSSGQPTAMTDLPTFTGRRFRTVLSMCGLADDPNSEVNSELSLDERCLAYLGERIGEDGNFLCLMLTSAWELQPRTSHEVGVFR